MKLKVGQTVKLVNGDVHEVERVMSDSNLVKMHGYGPFIINNMCYHENGKFGLGAGSRSDVAEILSDPTETNEDLLRDAMDLVEAFKAEADMWRDRCIEMMYKEIDGEL